MALPQHQIVITFIFACTNGYKIENTQQNFRIRPAEFSGFQQPTTNQKFSSTQSFPGVNDGPIAGYPKVPPPNAYLSGGHEDDLLPPFEESKGLGSLRAPFARRSVEEVPVDPKTGYPLQADPSWKDAGGNEEIIDLPLEAVSGQEEEAVDPKTGYPLKSQPSWKFAGGDGDILQLPLEENTDSLISQEQEPVDPKTGYPLKAQPQWKFSGGNEDILELPLEELAGPAASQKEEAVDPKTGYPLVAQPSWKDAGGNEETIELPFENSVNQEQEQEAVDPKTGYPLKSQPGWRFAGGDGDILQLPLEDSVNTSVNQEEEPVDPKTGYPLRAQASWQDAGGNEEILELPLEDSVNANEKPEEGAVDPKTGYPLVAQPSWKDAGGDGDILELPLEELDEKLVNNEEKVDPKTGYPLVAKPEWKYSGGNEEILELPFDSLEENSISSTQRTNEISYTDGFKGIFPPLQHNTPRAAPTFGVPFTTPRPFSSRAHAQPSPPPRPFFSTNKAQGFNSFGFQGNQNRPIESTYTYTGPESVVVTVTRYLNTDTRPTSRPVTQGVFTHNGFNNNGFNQNKPIQNNFTSVKPSTYSTVQNSTPQSIPKEYVRSLAFQNSQSQTTGKPFQLNKRQNEQSTFPKRTDYSQTYSNPRTRNPQTYQNFEKTFK